MHYIFHLYEEIHQILIQPMCKFFIHFHSGKFFGYSGRIVYQMTCPRLVLFVNYKSIFKCIFEKKLVSTITLIGKRKI